MRFGRVPSLFLHAILSTYGGELQRMILTGNVETILDQLPLD